MTPKGRSSTAIAHNVTGHASAVVMPSRTPASPALSPQSTAPAPRAAAATTASRSSALSRMSAMGAPIAQPIPPAGRQSTPIANVGIRCPASNPAPPVSAPTAAAAPSRVGSAARQPVVGRAGTSAMGGTLARPPVQCGAIGPNRTASASIGAGLGSYGIDERGLGGGESP